jgi:hypothetical protein
MIDIHKLEEKLNELPGKIRDQKLLVVEKDKLLEETKLEYNVRYGMALLGANKPNATEKKSEAVMLTEDFAKDVIKAEYELKKEEAALKYLEDKFISCRKISSLEQEIMRSQLGGQ